MKALIRFIFLIVIVNLLLAFLVSCEKEEAPVNDCKCVSAIYKNVVNGNSKAFYNEPIQCLNGEAKPLQLVKGNYVFVKCSNAPEY